MQGLRHWSVCLGLAMGLAVVAAGVVSAEDKAEGDAAKANEPLAFGTDQTIYDLNKMKWQPLELDGFPKGGEFALLRGDMKHGAELIARVPPGFQVPNHNHTSDETIIWLKGPFTYINGVDGKAKKMSGQAYASLPGNTTPHSVRCGDKPCMFYLRFSRGFDYKIHPMPETLTEIN